MAWCDQCRRTVAEVRSTDVGNDTHRYLCSVCRWAVYESKRPSSSDWALLSPGIDDEVWDRLTPNEQGIIVENALRHAGLRRQQKR